MKFFAKTINGWNQRLKSYMHGRKNAQEMNFSMKYLFSKCDQILSFLRVGSYLLKKSLIENFTFCAVNRKEKKQENLRLIWWKNNRNSTNVSSTCICNEYSSLATAPVPPTEGVIFLSFAIVGIRVLSFFTFADTLPKGGGLFK